MQNKQNGGRDSRFELLRILAMLLIVANHYVGNSGVTDNFNYENISFRMIFLQLWGMWGKTAINAFVMISGYFMCKSKLTINRFLKIFLEVLFYRVIIYIVLLLAGYETMSLGRIGKLCFNDLLGVNKEFTASFLFFYLFIPFYNMLIEKMSKREHKVLIYLLLILYTGVGTFFNNRAVFDWIGWYFTIYLIAAYVRLYPAKWMDSNRACALGFFSTVLLSYLSVIAIDFLGPQFGFYDSYYMVKNNSNKLFALAVGVFMFLFFRNLEIKQSKFINMIASTTFGVLCIHASSDAMRTFLWKDLLNVREAYNFTLAGVVFHAVISLIFVFTACSLIDIIRIKLIEKPVFGWLRRFGWLYKELW